MTSEQQKLVDKIYTRALDLAGADREAYLRAHCTNDEIRREVDLLLKAAEVASDRFDSHFSAIRERVWGDVISTDATAQEDLSGQRVGNWRIGSRIARGGLATVYFAHRDDGEFEQTVALKVLRRGLDTDDLIARFRAERQILSTLDHPAIAQILDGGALSDGRPYLVLEYVDGVSITAYCEREELSVHDRVRLVCQVLRALHHAHKHLVVHRDIKPSNILVSAEGNVALLDFGIAKLLDPDALPGASTFTRTGVSLLTPGYGSPEQLAGEPVTTASDIYQVGVVLYELLAGQRPSFERGEAGPDAPSRQLKGTRASGEVRGDLDAIVLKAMHTDPSRRYGSANEMVADLERYLAGRPVVAQPDTLGYHLQKLIKRRPWLLPISTIFLLGVVAYIVTLTLYSSRLRLEQQRSEAAQAFMVDLFRSSDPYAPADPERGRNITAIEALALGRARLETELSGQPELKATLLTSIAGVYSSLDQNEPAIELGEQALALNLTLSGEKSEAVLEDLRLLADNYSDTGDYDHARDYYERQLGIARAMYKVDDPHLGVAEVESGSFELTQGNLKAGAELLESGIGKLRREPEKYAETLITAIVALTEQEGLNDPRESLELLDEALAVAETVYGTESLHAANVRIAKARAWVELQDFKRAKSQYALGLAIYDRQLGPNHIDTIMHYNNYGFMLIGNGDFAGAEAVHRELIDRLVAARGENHRLVADNYQNLATAIARQGRLEEALPLHRKAYETYQAAGWDHFRTVFPLLSIAYIELQRKNADAALEAATTALDRFRIAVPGTFLEGIAMCLAGLAKEQEGNVVAGSAMVEASHPLIAEYDFGDSPYPKLCRVPGAD